MSDLELLIHTSDTFCYDIYGKAPSAKTIKRDKESNMKQGYLAAVKPVGSPWGRHELDPKRFLRIMMPANQFNPDWLLRDEKGGLDLTDRIWRFDLNKILSLGEYEALTNITYNEVKKRPPIIKGFENISDLVRKVDWSNQPKIIKLHGSSGTHTIQEAGGGDYTLLQLGVETEAGAMDADVNFIISGTWAATDASNWDIDGYTMAGYNMLIQTQGASRNLTGIYSAASYHRIVSGGTQVFDVETPNVTIDGLQWQLTGDVTTEGVEVSSIENTTILFDHCICNGTGKKATGIRDATAATNVIVNVHNSVFYSTFRSGSEGIYSRLAGTTWNIRNCSIVGWDDAIELDAGVINVTNCTIFNNADDFDEAGGAMTVTYTASEDGHAGVGNVTITQSASNYAALVTDMVNGDLSITDASSELYDVGTDLSGVGIVDDVTGMARSQYDAGAFELPTASGPDIIQTVTGR